MIKLFLILMLNVSVLIFISCENKTENKSQIVQKTDKTKIIGEWLRTDSDYMIKIAAVNDDGLLLAQYFNPNPINVSKAEWLSSDGFIKIYLELRDENYPGSNYNLTYIPERDMMVGDYFQAVEGLTFYVEFKRTR